jgi:hypothetical protein
MGLGVGLIHGNVGPMIRGAGGKCKRGLWRVRMGVKNAQSNRTRFSNRAEDGRAQRFKQPDMPFHALKLCPHVNFGIIS